MKAVHSGITKSGVRENIPQVTVIIPILPRKNANITIESLKIANYLQEKIEVIVVEGRQPAKQRNAAIKLAKGEFIFFFDDDVTVHPNIFNQMLKSYNGDVAVVGGPNLTPETDSLLQKCFGFAMMSYLGAATMSKRYKTVGKEAREATEKDLILCNLSGRRDVLINNLFMENLYPNEENELLNRLISKGYKLIYNPDAVVYHSRRTTIKSFIKQNFNYGRGRAKQILVQPFSFEPLFLIPTLFVFYLFSLLIVTNSLYSIPLILYLLMCFVFSLKIAVKRKNVRILLLLPWIFPLIHIPYGLGFIYGFIRNLFFKNEQNVSKLLIKIWNLSELVA